MKEDGNVLKDGKRLDIINHDTHNSVIRGNMNGNNTLEIQLKY